MYPKIEQKQISRNFTPSSFTPQFIVLHDTGNASKSADAMAHYKYFCDKGAMASYNYICDKNRIIECVPPGNAAWHTGVGKAGIRKDGRRTNVTNYTSMGVSYCINDKENIGAAIENAAFTCAMLCVSFNLNENQVVRHFDSSGKLCPNTMLDGGTWEGFWAFKKRVGKLILQMKTSQRIVMGLLEKGYITDKKYWVEALNGQRGVDMQWLRILLDRASQ